MDKAFCAKYYNDEDQEAKEAEKNKSLNKKLLKEEKINL
jgi:hypothetical protein